MKTLNPGTALSALSSPKHSLRVSVHFAAMRCLCSSRQRSRGLTGSSTICSTAIFAARLPRLPISASLRLWPPRTVQQATIFRGLTPSGELSQSCRQSPTTPKLYFSSCRAIGADDVGIMPSPMAPDRRSQSGRWHALRRKSHRAFLLCAQRQEFPRSSMIDGICGV